MTENLTFALTDETRKIVDRYLNRCTQRKTNRRAQVMAENLKKMLNEMRLNPDKYSHKPATFTRLSLEIEKTLMKTF